MKNRIAGLILFCAALAISAHAQQFFPPGGGITVVTSLPAKCTSGQQFVISGTGQTFVCIAGNFVPGAPSFNVAAFGAIGDSQQISDGSFLASGNSLTSASNPFTSSDVGKSLYCNNGQSIGETDFASGVKIATFVSAGSITTTANPLFNSTGGNGVCVWGTDSTVALKAASAAAVAAATAQPTILNNQGYFGRSFGPIIYIPNGGYMVTDCPLCIQVLNNAISPSIIGQSMAQTRFFVSPYFTPGARVITNGGYVVNSNGTNAEFAYFSVTGSNFKFNANGFTNPPAAVIEIATGVSRIHDIGCNHSQNGGQQACIQFIGAQQGIENITATGGGVANEQGIGCTFNGVVDGTVMSNSYCGNGYQSVNITGISNLNAAAKLTIRDSIFDECGSTNTACTQITGSKDIVLENVGIYGGLTSAGNEPLQVDGTSDVYISGSNIGSFGGPTNGSGIQIDSGGVVRATGNRFRSFGSGAEVSGAAGSKFVDLGGNFYYHGGTLRTGSTPFAGGIVPAASLTHAANTCYVTITFAAANMCNQFVDQTIQIFRVKAISNTSTTCAAAPVVTITDGTTTITLTITTGNTTWDSGAINSNFNTAGNTITVSTTAGTCAVPPTNFAVTYSYMSIGAN